MPKLIQAQVTDPGDLHTIQMIEAFHAYYHKFVGQVPDARLALAGSAVKTQQSRAIEPFKQHYQDFVGYPVDDQPFSEGHDARYCYSGYGHTSLWAHPLTRAGVAGIGGIAATLAVSFLLSEDSSHIFNPDNSQFSRPTHTAPRANAQLLTTTPLDSPLAPPESFSVLEASGSPAPLTGTPIWGSRPQQGLEREYEQWDRFLDRLTPPTTARPAAITPLPQEGDRPADLPIDPATGRLDQSLFTPVAAEGLTPETAPGATLSTPSPQQPNPSLLPVLQPTQTEAGWGTAADTPATPASIARNNLAATEATASPQPDLFQAEPFPGLASSSAAPDPFTQPTAATPLTIHSSVAFKGYDIAAPETVTPAAASREQAQIAPMGNPANLPLAAAVTPNQTLQSLQDFLALAQPADQSAPADQTSSTATPPNWAALTPAAAATAIGTRTVDEFQVVQLTAADYQLLWNNMQPQDALLPAPGYGFIDYQHRSIVLPPLQVAEVPTDASTR